MHRIRAARESEAVTCGMLRSPRARADCAFPPRLLGSGRRMHKLTLRSAAEDARKFTVTSELLAPWNRGVAS